MNNFFDFYGLPTQFPGKDEAVGQSAFKEKAEAVQGAMSEALEKQFGSEAMRRFIPFIQMYEFEALLFSEPAAFAKGIGKQLLENDFERIVSEFPTPEHINDSPQTAPSKRVEQLVLGYEKPIMGNLAAMEVGLTVMREKCHLFNNWLERLENLAS